MDDHDASPSYEEMLRAIGLLLDEEGLRAIRVWERDDGLIVQGYLLGEGRLRTLDLTHDDVRDVIQAARDRRRIAPAE
jgi:hypothetical protein